MRIFYESSLEYENEAKPGTFASITIEGDDEGPHFVFSNADEVILDLPIPVCEALMIRMALGRSARHAFKAAERDAWQTEPASGRRPLPERTPYGPREIPEPVSAEFPVSGYSPPASWAGPVPARRAG